MVSDAAGAETPIALRGVAADPFGETNTTAAVTTAATAATIAPIATRMTARLVSIKPPVVERRLQYRTLFDGASYGPGRGRRGGLRTRRPHPTCTSSMTCCKWWSP